MTGRALILLLAVAALVAAGCGAGAGDTPGGTSLLVTRDFGAHVLVLAPEPKIQGADTVMRLLVRNAHVTTSFGGKFVRSINGVAGGQQAGDPYDWFFYVNGVESGDGATEVRVHDGDRIWWDFHNWGGVMDTPAVVGSFPDPFAHGIDGKKLPTRVECAPPGTPACQAATDNLVNAGIIAAEGGFEASNVQDTLRVLVGDWGSLRHDIAAGLLEKPPPASGVFARMASNGRTIALYNAHGDVVRTAGAGTGLVAAVRYQHGQPVWIVTGTDAAGLNAAADALVEGVLKNHFAVIVRGPTPTALPLP
jgi:hypothetical protein